MNNQKINDNYLYEHLPKLDKILIDEIEKKVDYSYPISEEFDQKIRDICNQKIKKRKPVRLPKIAVVFIIGTLSMVTTGMIANAASGGRLYAVIKEFFGAKEITDENKDLIGAEIIYVPVEDPQKEGTVEESEDFSTESCFIDSMIVNSVADGVPLPASITEFETTEGITPEVIMTSSASAVFYQADYAGWECEPGDILSFNFSKYETNNGNAQKLSIGYILNGVMYDGVRFKELSGCYQLKIKEKGEYYIYVFSIASDYQTLKSGKISIN